MHQTLVIGNLGRDPEIKKFDNGGQVANFSVGVTERAFKTKSGVEVPAHTEWYRCVAKGALAETIGKYVKKGHKVSIVCKKHTREYMDADNNKRFVEEFIVSQLEMLTPKDKRDEPAPAAEPWTPPVEDSFTENKEELPF